MTKPINTHSGQICVVEVPTSEKLRERLGKIIQDEKYIRWQLTRLCHKPFLNFHGGWYDSQIDKIYGGVIYNVELPEALEGWTSPVLLSDITEEMAKGMVERETPEPRHYVDYIESTTIHAYASAIKSLKSLLASHGYDTSKNLLIIF